MNNSLTISDFSTAQTPVENYGMLEERAKRLTALIESLEALKSSNHWKVLEREVFEPELALLRKRLAHENDTTELFRLQGKVAWAEKKVDLSKLLIQYRSELQGIRKQING